MAKHIFVLVLGVNLLTLHQAIGKDETGIIHQAEKALQFAARDGRALLESFINEHQKSVEGASAQCSAKSMSLGKKETAKFQTSAQLYIFVSSSIPHDSIKILGQEAQKIGAHLVFRGLAGGTFKQTQEYMMNLGVAAEIDPPKFDEYQVTQVPTFILVQNKQFDRVVGHISLREALDQFQKRGELQLEAQEYQKVLQENQP